MPALDGLRAVAVLLVFVGHSFPDSSFPGGIGVDLFFVISGYLITLILLAEYDRTGRIGLGRFYLRRVLRLYPPLIVVVVAVVACWWLYETSLANQLVRGAVALTYTTNLVATLSEVPLGALQHTWSLALEEQFYLLWPLLLLFMLSQRWSLRLQCAIVGVLAAASTIGWVLQGGEDHLPFNPLTKAGGLLIGCLLAILVHRRPWQSARLAYAATAVIVGVVVLGSFGLMSTAYTHPIVTLMAPFVIAHLATGTGPLVRLLSWKPAARLGVISYGFYLWHFPVLVALQFNTRLPEWLIGAVGLLITLMLAELSMRFVEAPALRLKERLSPVPIASTVSANDASTDGPARADIRGA